jgi:transcriptional regulator with XRE-family HTH domain
MGDTAVPPQPKGLLRHAREQRGLNVTEAAQAAGVTPTRISQVERAETAGAVQLSTLERFARSLGYELRYQLVPCQPAEGLPTLAAEGIGGYVTVRRPPVDAQRWVDRLVEQGQLTPARRQLSDLPIPSPLTPEERDALGGRTLREWLIEDREADRW